MTCDVCDEPLGEGWELCECVTLLCVTCYAVHRQMYDCGPNAGEKPDPILAPEPSAQN